MKPFSLILTLFLALTPLASMANEGGFYIQDCRIETRLRTDGSMTIHETYHIFFTEPRHGIIRSISLFSTPDHEVESPANITDLETSTAVRVDEVDGFFNIRLGTENRTVIGPQEYSIDYVYHPGECDVDVRNYLSRTILERGWDCKVEHLSFRLTFNEEMPESLLKTFRVSYGSDEVPMRQLTFSEVTFTAHPQSIEGELSNLSPGEEVTLTMVLPKSYHRSVFARKLPLIAVAAVSIAAVVVLVLFFYKRRRKPSGRL